MMHVIFHAELAEEQGTQSMQIYRSLNHYQR